MGIKELFKYLSFFALTVLIFQNCSSSSTSDLSEPTNLESNQLNLDTDLSGNLIQIVPSDPLNVLVIDSNLNDQGQAVIAVRLNKADSEDITVEFETVDGTAMAGTHYAASNGSATISSGQTFTSINVPLLASENIDVMFEVRIANASKGTISRSSAFFLITANSIQQPAPVPTPFNAAIEQGPASVASCTRLDSGWTAPIYSCSNLENGAIFAGFFNAHDYVCMASGGVIGANFCNPTVHCGRGNFEGNSYACNAQPNIPLARVLQELALIGGNNCVVRQSLATNILYYCN